MTQVRHYSMVGRDNRCLISSNISGSSTQSGTPTPTNPIAVAPLQTSGGVNVSSWNLHGIGTYSDSYNYQTKVITRNINKIVLTGTETWTKRSDEGVNRYQALIFYNKPSGVPVCLSSHFKNVSTYGTLLDGCFLFDATERGIFDKEDISTVEEWKSWLAAQYAAGTPVIVYYPITIPTTEVSTPLITQALTQRSYDGMNSRQQVVIGKNLFNIAGLEGSSTVSYSDDTITINGANVDSGKTLIEVFPDAKVGHTYFLSRDSASTARSYIWLRTGGAGGQWSFDNARTLTASDFNGTIKFYGDSNNQTQVKMQIVEGSTAPTSYTPYTKIVTDLPLTSQAIVETITTED